MNTTFKPISALIVGSILSLGTLSSLPASAAILTWDFTYQPTQGTQTQWFDPASDPEITQLNSPFSSYTGSFSYDDSSVTTTGSSILDISSTFKTNFPNFNPSLTQYDAVANFQNGYLVGISTNWTSSKDVNSNVLGGSFVGQRSGNGLLSVSEDYLAGPHLLTDYLGEFNLTKRVDVKIPEPSLIWGLAGLSMVGLFTRRKNISKFADQ